MKKLSPKFLIIVAVVLSLIAAALTYSLLSKKVAQKPAPVNDTVPVVIAKAAIAPETIIKEEMLQLVQMPKEAAQRDSFRATKDVVGRRLVQPANAGDQLTQRRFSVVANSGLQVSIPKDKRAVTIAVNDVSSIAGFVKPGQYVDVINVVSRSKNMPTSGKMILQNVLVLGAGQRDMSASGSTRAEKVSTVTLAVDPRDAVKLRVAQQEGGQISLALRPLKPEEETIMGTLVVGSGAANLPSVSTAAPNMPSGPTINVIRGTGK